ncbi:MAG: Uma2 family endonuclease [Pyrinomonadaceae bacterium]|nr:Uma2 family endonuclease [Pyrinomonadaceae bacterium]
MATRILPLITVAELDACPDDGNRYELIEGELFVSRAPRLPHQLVLHNLQVALASYLKQNPIGKVVPGPGAVFSDYNAVIPDLVFVRNESWDRIVADERFVQAPDLVIEILSPGKQNRERDLSIKRQLYSRYGVEEYWIVDPENRGIEVFRQLEQSLEKVSTVRDHETLKSSILPGLELDVHTIFDR